MPQKQHKAAQQHHQQQQRNYQLWRGKTTCGKATNINFSSFPVRMCVCARLCILFFGHPKLSTPNSYRQEIRIWRWSIETTKLKRWVNAWMRFNWLETRTAREFLPATSEKGKKNQTGKKVAINLQHFWWSNVVAVAEVWNATEPASDFATSHGWVRGTVGLHFNWIQIDYISSVKIAARNKRKSMQRSEQEKKIEETTHSKWGKKCPFHGIYVEF